MTPAASSHTLGLGELHESALNAEGLRELLHHGRLIGVFTCRVLSAGARNFGAVAGAVGIGIRNDRKEFFAPASNFSVTGS